ncbi:unnamed protein product [Anisakis simplex]|uniref:FoP_duplication domain-containing protein n=1 Tax=Anisakis simplex TaxID=6269 RepID=A0A0M3JQX0_ANISI|nr:unnamed protein product [Anisakis simplex]
MDVPIPARIILMGTSKITLDERFSKLPKSLCRHTIKVSPVGYRSADHDYRDSDDVEYSSDLDYKNGTAMDEEEFSNFRFVPRYTARTPLSISRPVRSYWRPLMPLNLRDRIKFPTRRNYPSFTSARGFLRRGAYSRSNTFLMSRPLKDIRPKQIGFNNTSFKSDQYAKSGAPRGVRGVRGRGRAGLTFPKRQPISREQLDKELDAYMKRGKHPKIDVSDLMQT